MVTIRISTDKSKLAIANVKLLALQNYKTERIVTFDRELNRIGLLNDACRFEAIINKMDFLKIKATNVLRIEVSNLLRNDTILVEFETKGMLNALMTKITRDTTNKALTEQTFLQNNLLFNLNHKAKEYLQCPNVTQDLGEQFDAMKLKLINEVNDPQLLKASRLKRKPYTFVRA